jgi:hypothetical protein
MDDAVRHDLETVLTTAVTQADLETVLATAVTQAISNPKESPSLVRREASLELDKAALREDKVALRERERRLDQREAVLLEREGALVQREAALAGAESQQPAAFTRAATLATLATNSSSGKHRKADPVDNVPALVEAYQTSGGVVPLGVLVAEVAALQQAASRLRTVSLAYDVQLKQLEEREKLELTNSRRSWLEQDLARMKADKEHTEAAVKDLIERYAGMRDTGVERFTPLLLQTVTKYEAAFEGQMNAAGEGSLERIGALCETVSARYLQSANGRRASGAPFGIKNRRASSSWHKKQDEEAVRGTSTPPMGAECQVQVLRQKLPSALPCTSLATLMLLLDLAIKAGPNLLELARETAAAVGNTGVEVVVPSRPTKGVPRALQKTLEEYEGDYTRLLDYARITLVFEELSQLEEALAFLLAAERAPRFVAVRTKDRLSRSWNAEMSGGNRDVMLNGWLELGGGRSFIVELQLHLRCLYELKSDLHVLYAGARVLGATEDATVSHEGKINGKVLERAARGVIRKVSVPFSPWDVAQQEQLDSVLKQEPCALLELDMSYASCPVSKDAHPFDGRTLADLLQPDTGTLACRRLQILRCGWNGIAGPIPSSIEHCHSLQELLLGNNQLTGKIPACIGSLKLLKKLGLYQNKFSGLIPETLGELHALEELALHDNMLSGQVPSAALAKLVRLKDLQLGASLHGGYSATVPEKWQRYMRERGVYYCDGSGNKELWISAAGQAEILEAAASLRPSQEANANQFKGRENNWWPKVVG